MHDTDSKLASFCSLDTKMSHCLSTRSNSHSQEDEKLRGLVQAEANKEPKWTVLAKSMGIRTGKQCRERWTQHLRPGLVKGKWTAQEDALVTELQGIHGNK